MKNKIATIEKFIFFVEKFLRKFQITFFELLLKNKNVYSNGVKV